MRFEMLARIVDAVLLPAALIFVVWASRPAQLDHTWSGAIALLGIWVLRRVWKATDGERPYKFRTLKFFAWLLLFGIISKLVMLLPA